VCLTRGRRSGRNEEAGNNLHAWRWRLRKSSTSGVEIRGARRQQIIVRIARQAAVADVLLDHVADSRELLVHNHRGGSGARRWAKRLRQSFGGSAMIVVGSCRVG